MLFTFFYILFWNVFSSNKNSQLKWKWGHKQEQIFMRDIHCCCPTLTKTGLRRHILTKHCDFQFSKNQLGGFRVAACRKAGRTGRPGEDKRRTSASIPSQRVENPWVLKSVLLPNNVTYCTYPACSVNQHEINVIWIRNHLKWMKLNWEEVRQYMQSLTVLANSLCCCLCSFS